MKETAHGIPLLKKTAAITFPILRIDNLTEELLVGEIIQEPENSRNERRGCKPK